MDLVDKCFNYFSLAHIAANCRQKTRYFWCRSYVCPGLSGGSSGNAAVSGKKGRMSVWRCITPTQGIIAFTPSPAMLTGEQVLE